MFKTIFIYVISFYASLFFVLNVSHRLGSALISVWALVVQLEKYLAPLIGFLGTTLAMVNTIFLYWLITELTFLKFSYFYSIAIVPLSIRQANHLIGELKKNPRIVSSVKDPNVSDKFLFYFGASQAIGSSLGSVIGFISVYAFTTNDCGFLCFFKNLIIF